MRAINILFTTISIALLLPSAHGQIDTLRFANGDEIHGEIKAMDKGVLSIETDYSDDDFQVEWENIQYISTANVFLISLSDGRRLNGTVQSQVDSLLLLTAIGGQEVVSFDEVVFLSKVEQGFVNRFQANIDLSASLTKANNLRQFGIRSGMGYQAERWAISGSFNNIFSEQEDADRTERSDANVTFRQLLTRGFFFFPEATYLSNTEQRLDLRFTALLGLGKYIFRTNRLFWNVTAGIANTTEKYSDETPDNNSYETFFGTNINIFDMGDLSLQAKGTAYPSLTERDRLRVDAQLDVKYDLPLDFYIKVGTTYNFDSQPAESGSKDDYVIQTGFGWEF